MELSNDIRLDVSVTYSSVKNATQDKPNEDALNVNTSKNIFAIADGVSRIRASDGTYPSPSPSAYAAKILVDESVNYLLKNTDDKLISETHLIESLIYANNCIAHYNHSIDINCDYAGSVGIIVRIIGSTLLYAYIGDCFGIHCQYFSMNYFTENQTIGIENYLKENKNISDIEAIVRRDIRNNSNHPLGWGVLTGEEKAVPFIRSGRLKLQSKDRIFLSTDGLAPIFVNLSNFILERTLDEIIEEMLKIEAQDGIRSDDKTIISINVS